MDEFHLNPTNRQSTEKDNTYSTICCIYTVYLLVMGYKYAGKHVEVD